MYQIAAIQIILLVLAKVQEANGQDGYGFFIVDTTRPGVAFGDDITKPGLQGLPVNSVTFDQVKLPEDSLLGLTLNGESQLNDIIKKLQLGLSAISIGIAEGAFEKGLAFVKVKRGFGKRLIDADSLSNINLQTCILSCVRLNLTLPPTRIGEGGFTLCISDKLIRQK